MTAHHILPEALAELDEASTWYEEHEEGLGLDLVGEYRGALGLRVDDAADRRLGGLDSGRR